MMEQGIGIPLLELVSAENTSPSYSLIKRDEWEPGRVRFDDVPPGRYFVRLGQFFRGWESGRVLSEVEVTAGSITEVDVRLPLGRLLQTSS